MDGTNVFKSIEQLASVIHVPLCWLDTKGIFLGGNSLYLEAIGVDSSKELVGQRSDQIFPKDTAEEMLDALTLVANSKRTAQIESPLCNFKTKRVRCFFNTISPLYDEYNAVIGVVITAIDITEKNHHLEDELKNDKAKEQEKFKAFASKVAHDLRGPLGSISILTKTSKSLAEKERAILKSSTERIGDIANNLSNYGEVEQTEQIEEKAKTFPHILVSLALSEVISAKRLQYESLPIKINCTVEFGSDFVFVKASIWSFNRMINNLISNAVDSFTDNKGVVDVTLGVSGEQVKITVQDDGKGMPEGLVKKILNNFPIGGNKKGAGIGFAQVRATLQACKGKMSMESELGKSTKVILTLPRVEAAEWAAEELDLNKGDTVVILDDDLVVHESWVMGFRFCRDSIDLQLFTQCQEALNFVNNFPDKNKLFLLVDFELANQGLTGLQFVEKLEMQKSSYLVTGYYNDPKVRKLAAKAGVKILPKQLVQEILVKVKEAGESVVVKKVDFVIIDDEQTFADSLAGYLKNQSYVEIHTYYSPKRFLENLEQYPKDTKICMDYDFENQINGVELAKQLHQDGYTKLYLLSGKDFSKETIPDYLTVILKSDVEGFDKLVE